MSIIHDALKKVQQMNNAGRSIPETPFQGPVPVPDQTGTRDKMNIPLLVAALCAVVAMAFAALPQLTAKKNAAPAAPAVATQIPAAPKKEQPTPKPVTPAPQNPSANTMSKAVANAMASPVMPALKPPAQKIVDPNDPLSNIQVEGVMDMDGRKVALINGNIYEEGQTIYGHIISEITFDSLTIIENGRKRIFATKP